MNNPKRILRLFSIPGIFLVISIAFALPLLSNIEYWGDPRSDWDQHFLYQAVPRISILSYGQVPLWNPYYVGGTVISEHPSSGYLSPFYLFVLAFGEVVGLKIEIFAHLVVGLTGMFLLTTYLGLDRIASFFSSFVYMLGSRYAVMITGGMSFAIDYIPFIFLFFLKSLNNESEDNVLRSIKKSRKIRNIIIAACFLVLMFIDNGGPHTFSFVVLFLLTYSFFDLMPSLLFSVISFLKPKKAPVKKDREELENNKITNIVITISLILILTFFLGSIKFVPVISKIRENPRLVDDYSGYSLEILYHGLFNRNQQIYDQPFSSSDESGLRYDFFEGVTYGWSENGAYVGWIPFIFFVFGAISSFKKTWKLTLTSLVFLWLSFGNRTSISLWNVLHVLPIYSSLRVAQRFIIIFLFCLAIISGIGLSKLKEVLSQKIKRKNRFLSELAPLMLLISVLFDLVLVGNPVFTQAFTYAPPQNLERISFISFWNTVTKNIDQKSIDSNLHPIELYGDHVLAQSFTPEISNLSGIGLYKDRLGSPSNLVVKVYAENNSSITYDFMSKQKALTSTSISPTLTELDGGRFDWINLDFENLTIGERYWIVLYQENYLGNEENLYRINTITNKYPNGSLAHSWNRGTNWNIDYSRDLYFMTCYITEEGRKKFDEAIESNDKFRQIIGHYHSMYPAFLLNLGTVKGYEQVMQFQRYTIPLESREYRGEAFLWNIPGTDIPISGNVNITFFSPNVVKVTVYSSSEGKVVLNQNYSPGWKVEGSYQNKVESLNGLVSTWITEGQHNLTFYYYPESYIVGAILTIITIFVILVLNLLTCRNKSMYKD